MSAIAVFKEPSRTMRLVGFLVFTLPGALLAAAASAWIGAAIVYGEDAWIIVLALVPAILGARLVSAGTGTADKPLYLVVLLPMPVLMSLGWHLRSVGIDLGLLVGFGGLALPAIGCPLVNLHYHNRAEQAHAVPVPSPTQITPLQTQPAILAAQRLATTGHPPTTVSSQPSTNA